MIEARYNPNCTPDGNRSFGPPEIIVPYPEENLTPAEFDEYMEIALNENSYTVAELLQYICQEGYAEVDVVEQDSEGHFVIHAEEVVYSGCSDLDFRSDFDVKLTARKDSDGVHFCLSKNAVLSFNHWLGDGEDDD